MTNNVTPAELRPHAIRAIAARQAIAARFIAAAEPAAQATRSGPVAFPAYLSLRNMRWGDDGTMYMNLSIPAPYPADIYSALTTFSGIPLAATLEAIELPDTDPLA